MMTSFELSAGGTLEGWCMSGRAPAMRVCQQVCCMYLICAHSDHLKFIPPFTTT
jgi:hypothetical protein